MPRVVKSREEFEGEVYESLVLVEGKDLPVPRAGTEFVEIAHSRRRIDGPQRVTGRARYTQDIYLPGMLHVRVLRSPYPRARVRRIDTKKAEALPGVRGVLHRFNAPKASFRGEETIFREEVRFVGDEVAAIAADDEQTAVDALRLIEVDYELLPHVVDLEEAIGDMAPRLETDGNVAEAATHKRGDAKRGLREADFVVDATYRTSTQLHNSLETHRVRVHPACLRRSPGTPHRAQAALLEDPRALRLHGRGLRIEGRRWQVLDHRVALHDAARAPRPMRPHSRRRKSRGGQPFGHAAAAPCRREGWAHHGTRAHLVGKRGPGQMGREPDRADEHALRHREPFLEVVQGGHERGLALCVPRAGVCRGDLRTRVGDRRARRQDGRRPTGASAEARRVAEGPDGRQALFR